MIFRRKDAENTKKNPLDSTRGGLIAFIDERSCIGCTLCLQACPVDAILGAAQRMHTVIGTECTGCELCVAPCPVDCIAMIPDPNAGDRTGADKTDLARRRYAARRERLAREQAERAARWQAEIPAPGKGKSAVASDPRKAAIQAALERVRAKRAALRRGAKKPAPPA
ncbi:MAG: RnfABCDGE type electron transport complex subunit B [Gammaproteobacteria bacterium]|nr:RnfABCDGE type electron transport complex subunit B [Gammaproteobacteria bacterium]